MWDSDKEKRRRMLPACQGETKHMLFPSLRSYKSDIDAFRAEGWGFHTAFQVYCTWQEPQEQCISLVQDEGYSLKTVQCVLAFGSLDAARNLYTLHGEVLPGSDQWSRPYTVP